MASKTYIEYKQAKEEMDIAWGIYLKSLKLIEKIDDWGMIERDDSNPYATMIVEIHHAIYEDAKTKYEKAKKAHFHR